MQMDKGGDICTPICSGKSKGLQSSENSRKIIFRRLHLEGNNLEVSNGDKDWWGPVIFLFQFKAFQERDVCESTNMVVHTYSTNTFETGMGIDMSWKPVCNAQ